MLLGLIIITPLKSITLDFKLATILADSVATRANAFDLVVLSPDFQEESLCTNYWEALILARLHIVLIA